MSFSFLLLMNALELFSQGSASVVIDDVSVDGANVRVSWRLNGNQGDIDGFKIERWDYYSENLTESSWKLVKTIFDPDARSFVDSTTNAATKKRIYQVRSFKGVNEGFPSPAMQTVWLDSVMRWDICSQTNTIRWTGAFEVFHPTYLLYFKTTVENDWHHIEIDHPLLVDSVETYETTVATHFTPVFSFAHSFSGGFTYQYMIVALISGNSCCSNRCSATTSSYQFPVSPFVHSVSVQSNDDVLLELNVPEVEKISGVALYRDGVFVRQLEMQGHATMSILDTSAFPREAPCVYSLSAVDVCGNDLGESNAVSSIWLRAVVNEKIVNLGWNITEQGFPFSYYKVYRKVLGEVDFVEIGQTSNHYFSDDLTASLNDAANFAYRVEMIGADGSRVFSNCHEVRFESDDFVIPNAFIIGGYTPTFGPLFEFPPHAAFSFRVFDRLGGQLFLSEDYKSQWDGTFHGNPVQAGTYIWQVSYVNTEGMPIVKHGTFVVMH